MWLILRSQTTRETRIYARVAGTATFTKTYPTFTANNTLCILLSMAGWSLNTVIFHSYTFGLYI
jgi:hypothetical protein